MVDIGDSTLQIVTGANNIKVGDIVPIACDGASLPCGVKIKTGKLRGVDSCGMMCSVGELGLDIKNYKDQIEHGIMILPKEFEKRIGESIVDVLELKEEIIDFEITPNRPDCLSIEGLGRETAITLGVPFKAPHRDLENQKQEKKDSIEGLRVDVEAEDLCYRYIARVVKDVKVTSSPKWLVRRLNSAGIRSINNIVDITNYCMLELGQPMHAFDIEQIAGKHIIVRRAKDGEKIVTLDGEERILDSTMLVIADEEKSIACAGVMGGANSEIEETTKTIVLESAVFYGGNIRKTAKALSLRTDASSYYEKGLSPENSLKVINRAAQLIEELGAGKVEEGIIDVYKKKQKETKILFNPNKINSLIGTDIPKEEMLDVFNKLEIRKEGEYLIPPYFRQDIESTADLAEEVLRFYGYDKLQTTLPESSSTLGMRNKEQKIEDKIKSLLVDLGLSEIYTYGLTSKKELAKINLTEENKEEISLQNPLSEDYKVMRTTTISSMMQTLTFNYNKKNENVKLFDISRTYKNTNNQIERNELPEEELVLTIGMYGKDIDFYKLKEIIKDILKISNIGHYEIEKQEKNICYHPGRSAVVKIGNDIIATFGEIHPKVSQNYDINAKCQIAEISLPKITKYSRQNKKYREVPKFPTLDRDIAMVVNEEIEVGRIEKQIEKKAKKLLESIELFDIYRNEKIGSNKKSVAFRLKFRTPDRTLKDDEVNKIMEEIINSLEKELNAELRS